MPTRFSISGPSTTELRGTGARGTSEMSRAQDRPLELHNTTDLPDVVFRVKSPEAGSCERDMLPSGEITTNQGVESVLLIFTVSLLLSVVLALVVLDAAEDLVSTEDRV